MKKMIFMASISLTWLTIISPVYAQVTVLTVDANGSIKNPNGDDVQQGGTAYPSQGWDIRRGTAATPISTPGAIFKISKTENFSSTSNAVDNYNNAALNVQVQAATGSKMQANAVFASVAGAPSVDILAGSFLARHSGTDVNYGAYGIYAEGRTDNVYARAIGGEFRSANYSNTSRLANAYNAVRALLIANGLAH